MKAHGSPVDIEGVTVAIVNDKLQLKKVEVSFDPISIFRQMAGDGSGVSKDKHPCETTINLKDLS